MASYYRRDLTHIKVPLALLLPWSKTSTLIGHRSGGLAQENYETEIYDR